MKTDNGIKVIQPKNLTELDEILLNTSTEYQFIAGGTDLLVQNKKWLQYNNIIDLKSITQISEEIFVKDDFVYIGSATSYTDIINNKLIKENFPILISSFKQIGSVQIQNRGTIGGNICNASPAGDSLPVLSVLDADLLIGPKENGSFKEIPLNSFFTDFKKFKLDKNEYIAFIKIKLNKNRNFYSFFRKVGQRYSMAISKVSLALIMELQNSTINFVRISTGSVKPYIKREYDVENYLFGKINDLDTIEEASKIIKQNILPISDIRSNKLFREYLIGQLLKEAL
ncbi:MAG TPA: FAD binding domain-containing protein, partial [Melioribacteraceae bacterium]|nr:FAD binding domain-containing protein [Melioribacteraceae bacterium]